MANNGYRIIGIYSHNIVLSEEKTKDPKAILDVLRDYFKPAKNVIYERYMFGCCKQEVNETAFSRDYEHQPVNTESSKMK